MKRTAKLLVLLTLFAAIAALFMISSSAADNTVYYTVTSKDGTIVEYRDKTMLCDTVAKAKDGDTITLRRNVEINSSITLDSTKDSPRTVNFDLAGYGIYSYTKINMFYVNNYSTANVYSSKEGGFIYVVDKSNANYGGSIFFAIGKYARINFGTMLVNGTVYPGSNITTFASSFINVQGEGTDGVYGDGGTHFANIADWNGFICLRAGNGDVSIKNMDLVPINNSYLIYGVANTKGTLYMENCRMIRADGAAKPIFNQSYGQITFKNCISNYSLTSGTSANALGNVTLEGNNVFGGELGIDTKIVKDAENKIPARVNCEYTFMNGTKEVWYYDTDGKFNKSSIRMPEITSGFVFAPEEETIEYTWVSGKDNITQTWLASEEPVFPILLTGASVEGMYKPHWTKLQDGRKITYTSGLGLDFPIKTSIVYDTNLYMNIYVPAHYATNGYLDFTSITIDGESYGKSVWSAVTVDGEEYYRASTLYINEENVNDKIVLKLVCDFDTKTHAESTYTISISSYLDKAVEMKYHYSTDVIDMLKMVSERYFPGKYDWS